MRKERGWPVIAPNPFSAPPDRGPALLVVGLPQHLRHLPVEHRPRRAQLREGAGAGGVLGPVQGIVTRRDAAAQRFVHRYQGPVDIGAGHGQHFGLGIGIAHRLQRRETVLGHAPGEFDEEFEAPLRRQGAVDGSLGGAYRGKYAQSRQDDEQGAAAQQQSEPDPQRAHGLTSIVLPACTCQLFPMFSSAFTWRMAPPVLA